MKRITFKTLSILLAAVLLVPALPVAAFAENVSLCDVVCNHIYETYYEEIVEYYSDQYHTITTNLIQNCSLCGVVCNVTKIHSYEEVHNFGDNDDPEINMSVTCIYCGAEISW